MNKLAHRQQVGRDRSGPIIERIFSVAVAWDDFCMGIRCSCPNGHKLHLKSFLAGKKGICPECDARFRIPSGTAPSEPTRTTSVVGKSVMNGTASAVAVLADPSDVESQIEVDVGPDVGPVVKKFGKGNEKPSTSLKSRSAPVGSNGNVARPSATASVEPDPISNAPDAVWYVRPPSGGQFGPARGEVMRKWLSEGRVSSDSYIWREGWPDWQLAGSLFSKLPAAEANAGIQRAKVTVAPELSIKVGQSSPVARSKPVPARARGNSLAIGFMALLAVISISLLVALAYVISGH